MIGVEVEGRTIVITMTGIVSEADWKAALSALEDKLGRQASVHFTSPRSSKMHLLMDWEKLEGWDTGTRLTCTWFCMGNRDIIDRLAVIAEDKWQDETERLVDIYKSTQINFYSPIQRERAIKWLEQSDA